MTWHKHQSSTEMAEVELVLHPDFGERQSLTTQFELFKLILA